MYLGSRFDMLWTFTGMKHYSLEKDGSFTSIEKYFNCNSYNFNPIVSKAEITVPLVDESGDETGENVTLPSGTEFNRLRTDGNNNLDCTIKDGRIIRFHLERATVEDSYGYMGYVINGISEFELFEELMYAG